MCLSPFPFALPRYISTERALAVSLCGSLVDFTCNTWIAQVQRGHDAADINAQFKCVRSHDTNGASGAQVRLNLPPVRSSVPIVADK